MHSDNDPCSADFVCRTGDARRAAPDDSRVNISLAGYYVRRAVVTVHDDIDHAWRNIAKSINAVVSIRERNVGAQWQYNCRVPRSLLTVWRQSVAGWRIVLAAVGNTKPRILAGQHPVRSLRGLAADGRCMMKDATAIRRRSSRPVRNRGPGAWHSFTISPAVFARISR